jgi:hypothetical protein
MLANIPALATSRFVADRERDLALHDLEALFLSAVYVWRWTATRRNDGFPQSIFPIRVISGGQEAIYVADDSDGATFSRFSNDGS